MLTGFWPDREVLCLDHLFCVVVRESLRLLLSVLLFFFHISQACVLDPRQLFGSPLHVFLFFRVFLLTHAGAVIAQAS